jgi:predicted nucleic acid-binding protein
LRFIDTNVFIRFLTQDDPVKARASGEIIGRLERGDEEMLTSEMVIGEVVYILSARAHYGMTPVEIRDRLAPVVRVRGLRVAAKSVLLRGLDLYATYTFLDFEDALSVAHMESAGISEIVSYDRGFDRVEEVVRVEP